MFLLRLAFLYLVAATAGDWSTSARAEAVLAPVFSDHMVLQRELPVAVWGTAATGESVTVRFAGEERTTTADAAGAWSVSLGPFAASTESRELTVSASNAVTLRDVLVGEVWLCSGQSNMEKQLGPRRGQQPCDNHEAELAAASYPLLRLYQVPRDDKPVAGDATLRWLPCSPATLGDTAFSAAGYYFGRKLQGELGVPVGLIHASVGGTRIEPWTPPSAYAAFPALAELGDAASAGLPYKGVRSGGLYASMIRPLAPYALRGWIWYQGESNLMIHDHALYADKLRALITGWRAAWGRPDAPFYFVELAPHLYSPRKQARPLSSEALPLFWEAQYAVADTFPKAGSVTITDTVANLADIHPTNKRDVGERLARLALARTYGRADLEASGPVLSGATPRGAELVLSFDHARGLATRGGGAPSGFTVAGEDRMFVPAAARIEGETVVVSAPSVPRPVAARLAFHERADPDLINAAGLPARPARTDRWPVDTMRDSRADDPPVLTLPAVAGPSIPAHDTNLAAHGAVADGVTLNTAAFAAAIEAVASRGGGRIVVPAGVWRTGPIELRSRVALHLEAGAVIQFSDRREDYPLVRANYEGKETWRCQSPLSGVGLEDVAITGSGVIDGAGQVWRPVKKSKQTPGEWAALLASGGVLNAKGDIWYPTAASREGHESAEAQASGDPARIAPIKDGLRPVLLSLRDCKRVLLEGVTFQNSPSWCLHPLLCEDLTVRGVTVRNPWHAQNGDGLDLDSCKNVLVEDSTFDVGDDAICLKSGKDAEGRQRARPTENVTVRGCRVLHGHGGFVIGSEMSGGVRNVHVSDCSFIGTDVGLRFKSRRGRGGVVENVVIENVRMERIKGEAILFDLFYGGGSRALEAVSVATPAFRNVVMRGLVCEGAGRAAKLQGLPEMPLENIRLTDSVLVATEGLLIADIEGLAVENVDVTATRGPAGELRDARGVHWKGGRLLAPTASSLLVTGMRNASLFLPQSPVERPVVDVSNAMAAPLTALNE